METKQKILGGLFFVAAVIICTFLVTLFTKKNQPDNIDELIKAKQEIIEGVIRERDMFRAWKDEKNLALQKKDSVFIHTYKTNTIRYESIPVYINNLGNDSLRSAVWNFAE